MSSHFTLRQELQQIPPNLPCVVPLAIRVEWMRYCVECNAERRFVADQRCISGLIAECATCGDRRFVPFTRASTDPWEEWT